ncbi:uncharacterized [Tachysurus ichikawai]
MPHTLPKGICKELLLLLILRDTLDSLEQILVLQQELLFLLSKGAYSFYSLYVLEPKRGGGLHMGNHFRSVES